MPLPTVQDAFHSAVQPAAQPAAHPAAQSADPIRAPAAKLLTRRGLLAGLASAPAWAWAGSRRPALNLPLALDAPADPDPAGTLVSEKLDGVRAVWDGQQLRFRSGLPVPAPAWFTARLPATPLDGELWLGCGRFEALSGAVRRTRPDDAEWRALRYMVFELPTGQARFEQRAAALQGLVQQHGWPPLQAVPQEVVSGRLALQQRLAEVVRAGGEGLVLRRADAPYASGRSSAMQKLKPVQDADAVVLAQLPGRGRHAGRLGALQLQMADGTRFKLGTGFSDAQREQPPAVGAVVSFFYRGLTDDGLPRFASFWRERPAGL